MSDPRFVLEPLDFAVSAGEGDDSLANLTLVERPAVADGGDFVLFVPLVVSVECSCLACLNLHTLSLWNSFDSLDDGLMVGVVVVLSRTSAYLRFLGVDEGLRLKVLLFDIFESELSVCCHLRGSA